MKRSQVNKKLLCKCLSQNYIDSFVDVFFSSIHVRLLIKRQDKTDETASADNVLLCICLTMLLEGDSQSFGVLWCRGCGLRSHPFSFLYFLYQPSLNQIPQHNSHGYHVLLLKAGVSLKVSKDICLFYIKTTDLQQKYVLTSTKTIGFKAHSH